MLGTEAIGGSWTWRSGGDAPGGRRSAFFPDAQPPPRIAEQLQKLPTSLHGAIATRAALRLASILRPRVRLGANAPWATIGATGLAFVGAAFPYDAEVKHRSALTLRLASAAAGYAGGAASHASDGDAIFDCTVNAFVAWAAHAALSAVAAPQSEATCSALLALGLTYQIEEAAFYGLSRRPAFRPVDDGVKAHFAALREACEKDLVAANIVDSARSLLAMPLYLDMPANVRRTLRLAASVPEASWEVWISWYDERLRGANVDWESEKLRLFGVSRENWAAGAAIVNAQIKLNAHRPHQSQKRKIFVSHSTTADGGAALRLVDMLEKYEQPCWIAPRNILPGADWNEAIIAAIEECDGFVLLVSEAAISSTFVKAEVQHAFEQRKRILPVCLDGAEPGRIDLRLKTIQRHIVSGNFELLAATISSALRN